MLSGTKKSSIDEQTNAARMLGLRAGVFNKCQRFIGRYGKKSTPQFIHYLELFSDRELLVTQIL